MPWLQQAHYNPPYSSSVYAVTFPLSQQLALVDTRVKLLMFAHYNDYLA